MLANLTPQTDDALAVIYRVLDEIQDKDFVKNCANELKKVSKAKKDLAQSKADLETREKSVTAAFHEAESLKSSVAAELKSQKTKTAAIVKERKEISEIKKAFEAEKREFMNDINKKMNDAQLAYRDAADLMKNAETKMKQADAKEAMLAPKMELLEKLRA